MSSSRDHWTFTGMPPACFEMSAASHDAVVREPAAETAAAAQLMQRDLLLRQAKQCRDGVDGVLRRLRRRPDLDAVALEPSRAVLRLEIRVRDVVIRVQRFDGLARGERGFDVAGLAEHLLRRLRRQRLRLRDGARPAVARRMRSRPTAPSALSSLAARPTWNRRRSRRPDNTAAAAGLNVIAIALLRRR